ncbi:GNAT family N-acetyltransferase [Paenibacillus sp. KQZ6P-2]|uniref:GNAT family N-acetyltransferase n=1 Tax=Paenibacillus mangrovi TaxID=2931978 RepID=A0A9X1WSN5_9BACL|nr:GNAT family N-acetyltransferase [Paenibacillus mangrovi]MCJ8013976.1 GNAT family N-acetyltransferase [Paenibacillus mangrovi]
MIIRKVLPHELSEAAALSNFVFRQPEQKSMCKLFPYLFNPGISHSYGAFTEEGNMVAFMGMVPEIIRLGSARLHVFGLGSVCTHPDYRGQNIASRLLEECMDHAKRSGASLVFVSGDRSLYMRSGCQYFGRVSFAALNHTAASALQADAAEGWTIRSMVPEDIFAVTGLLSAAQAGYEQGPTQLLTLLGASAIPEIYRLDSQALVAIRNGKIQAFAVAAVHSTDGRSTASSHDPSQAVEWAGDVQGCALLFAEMLSRFPAQQMIIPVPWQEERLLELLKASGAKVSDGQNSGTVWMTDAAKLLAQCAPLLPAAWDQTFKVNSGSDNQDRSYVITTGREELTLDDNGLLSLLFDPESPSRSIAPKGFRTIPLPYLSGLHFV